MAEDKRERILAAALEVFFEQGFASASMAEIADRADVAKGTIYLYFTSKDQLIEAAFWHCHRRDVEACQEGLEEIDGAIGKLNRRLENVTRWALTHPHEIQMERMYYLSPHFGRLPRYQNQTLQFEAVDKIIREGIERGELKALPSPLMGDMFFGIGDAVLNYLTDRPESLEDRAFWHACHACVTGCLGIDGSHKEE